MEKNYQKALELHKDGNLQEAKIIYESILKTRSKKKYNKNDFI